MQVDIKIKTEIRKESLTSALVKTGGELDVKREFNADCDCEVKRESSTKRMNCLADQELVRFCNVCALNCADCRLDWKDGHIDNNETRSQSASRTTVKSESNVPNEEFIEQSEEVKKAAASSDTRRDVKRETLTLRNDAVNNIIDTDTYSVPDAEHYDKCEQHRLIQQQQQQQHQQQQQQAVGPEAEVRCGINECHPVNQPAIESVAQTSRRCAHKDSTHANCTAGKSKTGNNPPGIVGTDALTSDVRLSQQQDVDQELGMQQRCNKCHKLKRTVMEYSEEMTAKHSVTDNNSTLKCTEQQNTVQQNTVPPMPAEHPSLHNLGAVGENVFCCPECGKKFARADTLRRHMSSHGKNRKSFVDFKRCVTEDCADKLRLGANGVTADIYRSLNAEIRPTRPYRCPNCCKVFAYYGSMKQHIVQHSDYAWYGNKDPAKPHECKHCGKAFSKTAYLARHLRVHTGYRPYTCTLCSRCFSQQGGAKRHCLMHTRAKTHACPKCCKKFARKGIMKIHMRSHTEAKSYACQQCDKTFTRRGNLKQHAREHMRERRHKYQTCGKKLAGAVNYGGSADTGAKLYVCLVCGKTYAGYNSLRYHIRVHAGIKPFKCQQCEKVFVNSFHLKNHARVHSGEKPYLCEKCGRSFAQSTQLDRHVPTHAGEKPYPCAQCDKTFINTLNLKQHHRSVHSGIKELCPQCGRTFSQSTNLKRHCKKFH